MHLTKEEKETVLSIIKAFVPPDTKVFFFGSRMDGSSTPHSDLDILLRGPSPIILSTISLMREKFEESDLPFKVDLLDYNTLSKKAFKNISQTIIQVI